MAGFGYKCVLDGDLNVERSADKEKDPSITNTGPTPIPTRAVSGIREKRSLFLDKLLDDNTHISDYYSDLDDHDLAILKREKRRGGRGGVGRGGSIGRGGKGGRGGRGGWGGGSWGGSSNSAPQCASNYLVLNIVGCIFVIMYLFEICMLYFSVCGVFEKPFAAMLVMVTVCAIECLIYFVFIKVMFNIPTLDDKYERKRAADNTFGVTAVLYSFRSVAVLICSGLYFLRKGCDHGKERNMESSDMFLSI